MRRIDPPVIIFHHGTPYEPESLLVEPHRILVRRLHVQSDLVHCLQLMSRLVPVRLEVFKDAPDQFAPDAAVPIGGEDAERHDVKAAPSGAVRMGLHPRAHGADDESVPVRELAQPLVLPIYDLLVERVVVGHREARRVHLSQLLDVVRRNAAEVDVQLLLSAHFLPSFSPFPLFGRRSRRAPGACCGKKDVGCG
eukprot:CAMPEP_0183309244 /NCGR_PEP_ID=MMETSP0160_2-20130417/24634_1 /TAXON_ID=2839 ORGANISM="Odontella Sinensis, Strain Grunow 1884" /NCGR_SAMPLE_ID=MMETSP0160_2 /ASSEMBLY_ACC=CAM_ASM_000250 /LENGTH=194 /DNA_ID=CAMNT_0025473239 /DNA_START=464 /DNA_END=1044 /DNA_ORIENTATION=-